MHKCYTDTVQLPECHCGFLTYLSQYLQPGWVTISISNVCQCCNMLPAAADAPTQVSSSLTSCCLQMIHLCKLPPVCERSHCTTWRRTLAVREPRCRAMCTSRGVPAADTGTRMARTDSCRPKGPDTWLTQAACALSRADGRRELQMHLERDRSETQDGTPRIRSCSACQTRLHTSHTVVISHDPRRRRGVRSPGPLSRLSRTGRGVTHARTPRRRPPATTYVM